MWPHLALSGCVLLNCGLQAPNPQAANRPRSPGIVTRANISHSISRLPRTVPLVSGLPGMRDADLVNLQLSARFRSHGHSRGTRRPYATPIFSCASRGLRSAAEQTNDSTPGGYHHCSLVSAPGAGPSRAANSRFPGRGCQRSGNCTRNATLGRTEAGARNNSEALRFAARHPQDELGQALRAATRFRNTAQKQIAILTGVI